MIFRLIQPVFGAFILFFPDSDLNAQSSADTSVVYYYVPESAERSDVLSHVEKEAEYPGGYVELMRFLSKNLEYPEICAEMGVDSKLHLRLTIEKDGTVSLIQIRLRKDHDCLQEIEPQLAEWLHTMPKWTPAFFNGEPVACVQDLRINIHWK